MFGRATIRLGIGPHSTLSYAEHFVLFRLVNELTPTDELLYFVSMFEYCS